MNYQEEISKVFLTGEKETVDENMYFDKPSLIQAFEEKELYRANWNNLLSDVRKIRTDSSRVRDCEVFGLRHSYYASFQYAEPLKGIIFGVSFPFRIIGFRFSMFEELEHSVSSRKRYKETLSYFPFDAEMIGLSEDIKNRIVFYFPDFTVFDNREASDIIELIQIDCIPYYNIEMWKVLFSNPNGLF